MSEITMRVVEIEMRDDGTIMVGSPPQSEEMGQEDMEMDKEYMSPVQTLDDALDVAKDLLTGPTTEEAQQRDADMEAGFKRAQGL